MPLSPYKKIKEIFKSICECPGNSGIIAKHPQAAGNFLISLCLSCLYREENGGIENFPYGGINAGSLAAQFPSSLSKDYPFPGNMWIPEGVIQGLEKAHHVFGVNLPGVVREFILENIEKNRKQNGVFYTPEWIVRDIVNNTVKAYLDRVRQRFVTAVEKCDTYRFIRLWDKLEGLRILDPACGWGAFLIKAYDAFVDFYHSIIPLTRIIQQKCATDHFDLEDMFSRDYLNMVQENGIITSIRKVCKNPGRKILQHHIYGFDIDRTALTMASHLLRIRAGIEEHENGANLICVDFIKWMESPHLNFDIIIGNPPYFTIGGGGRNREKTGLHTALKEHPLFKRHFRSQSDIFYYFIIGAINILKPYGRISFIVPSYWLENEYADTLREEILSKSNLEEIIRFAPLRVFETAAGKDLAVDTMIFRAVRVESTDPDNQVGVFLAGENIDPDSPPKTAEDFLNTLRNSPEEQRTGCVTQSGLGAGKWVFPASGREFDFLIKNGREVFPLADVSNKIITSFPAEFPDNPPSKMEGVCRIGQGQETGLSGIFTVDRMTAEELKLEDALLRPVVKNGHVRRYHLQKSDLFMILATDEHDIENYPNTHKYLLRHRDRLEKRQRVVTGKRKWYSISIPQNLSVFEKTPKILVPYRAASCRFALDKTGYYNDGGDVRAIIIKDGWLQRISYGYLLALLNSSWVENWYRKAGKKKGGIMEFFTRPMSRIPVRIPDRSVQERISGLAFQLAGIYSDEITPVDEDLAAILEEEIEKLIVGVYGGSVE